MPRANLIHPAVWHQNRHGPKIGVGPHLTQVAWAEAYLHTKWHLNPSNHNRYGPKNGGLCPFVGGGAGSPCNTRWPGPRPTCMPSFILIHQTVWPQYTNITDRTDRQWSDGIGQTILQTVAQKPICEMADARIYPRSIYSKRLSEVQNWYGANADEVHIGTTWRIRLNRSCVVAMRPFVKLFWPLVIITLVVFVVNNISYLMILSSMEQKLSDEFWP